MPSDRYSPDKLNTENITYGGLVLHALEVDIDLSFCIYRASYVVWKNAHSARLDDATFVAEETRLITAYYPIQTWTCRAIWTNQEFTLPGFSNSKFKLQKENFIVDGRELKSGGKNTFNLPLDSTEEVRRLAIDGLMVWNGKHPRVQ